MKDSFLHPIYPHANEEYEQRLARHYYEAEVRRLLRPPGLRVRLATALRHLADRVDHSPVPLCSPSGSMG